MGEKKYSLNFSAEDMRRDFPCFLNNFSTKSAQTKKRRELNSKRNNVALLCFSLSAPSAFCSNN